MGVVARVSGPVVIAEGLEGAKMFDVVRVGQLGLVGEIIRLVGETATVQVYEDTTGIRPGDPVENSGQALSVELGPGLLKSIYDGVQRPLDILKKNLGDFITRGFVAPPLDEKATWEFKPLLKPGVDVTAGTILGTVQETPLILHKIMVPPGVAGKLEELKAGSFTIRDQIGSIRTSAGKVPLFLSQKWVVRIPRPVQQKLAPGVPLLTGQRVIDTFFPIAKGGTACIPGPFGSGKCVGGETPVLLSDGTLVPIAKLYEDRVADGAISVDGSDEWLEIHQPIGLFSLVGDRLVRSETSTLYRGKSDTLVRVRTRSGRTVRVTPVHRLFTFGPDGTLRETMAQDLKPGDYVASTRSLPAPGGDAPLTVERPRRLRRDESIVFPEQMTEPLAEFLGLFVAEGQFGGSGTLVLQNPDEELLGSFLALASSVFGLEGSLRREEGRVPRVVLHSRSLVRFVAALGTGRVAVERRIPQKVLASGNHVLGGFLRGYYHGLGSFSDGELELSAASRELQVQLSYALARFGVVSTMATAMLRETPHHRIVIRGAGNLGRITAPLGSQNPKSLALETFVHLQAAQPGFRNDAAAEHGLVEPVDAARDLSSGRLQSGIDALHPLGTLGGMSTPMFPALAHGNRGAPSFADSDLGGGDPAALLDDLFYDEVVDAQTEREGPYDVYDVSVPDFGSNFVGGFGGILLHNTVTQQQLAKWADSDVVVYVGCGERGNEMTEVLATFPNLQDPKSGRPLMERTILIANTSNMPVAAREASVYTGITIAEYYRDMGYDVALMADSTSRWAEAMREISGRLEEMPGEEGYPAYLGRRVAEFYERAGRVVTLSPEGRPGSVTVVGAVSPPGGDFAEPVSQNTLRVTRVFWALDASLASRRHFPSINWLQSYSLYVGDIEPWYRAEIAKDWVALRQRALQVLQQESELQEIVQLVGADALPEREKAVLDVARMLREDYLQQSAYDDVDTYTSIAKQYRMLRAILGFGDKEQEAIARGARVADLQKLPVRSKLSRMKWVPEKELTQFDGIELEMAQAVQGVAGST